MATIPKQQQNDLTNELNALSEEGQRMVLNALNHAEWETIEELRVIMVEVMEQVCGTMTDMAAARTADFYDDVRTASVGKPLGAEPLSGRVPEATEGAVRAGIQSVVETGAIEQFGWFLTARVDYEVKSASGECMYRNGKRDPLKPKFARVPSGRETCKFCIMLASRGFVYHDANAAGRNGHYHAKCDCRVVPGFGENPSIDGYDPDYYYEIWKDRVDGKPIDESLLRARARPTNVSDHAFDRSNTRDVSVEDIDEALDGPLHIGPVVFDKKGRPSVKVIGMTATVAYNPVNDLVVSVWRTGTKTRNRYLKGGDEDASRQ